MKLYLCQSLSSWGDEYTIAEYAVIANSDEDALELAKGWDEHPDEKEWSIFCTMPVQLGAVTLIGLRVEEI